MKPAMKILLLIIPLALLFSGCEVYNRSQMRKAGRDYAAGNISRREYEATMARLQIAQENYLRSMAAVTASANQFQQDLNAQQAQQQQARLQQAQTNYYEAQAAAARRPPQPTFYAPQRYRVTTPEGRQYEVQPSGIPLLQ